MTADLRASVPVAPDHLPQATAAIEAVDRAYATVPRVATMYGGRRGQWPPVLSPNSEPCGGSGV